MYQLKSNQVKDTDRNGKNERGGVGIYTKKTKTVCGSGPNKAHLNTNRSKPQIPKYSALFKGD